MGEMYDKISESEKNMMMNYIEDYVLDREVYREDRDFVGLGNILKIWEKKKKDLYEMFGGKLILSKPYDYKESQQELISRLLLQTSWHDFIRQLRSTITRKISNNDIECSGVETNFEYSLLYFPAVYIREECVDNKLYRGCQFTYMGKKYNFPKETKFMKFLGKLAEIADMKKEFEKFRVEHSMVLNNAKQHGKLCLSIHPLDFMTMSENNSDWSSCMNWSDGGCYRMGTVEMMNSPMVVVAYLTSSTPMRIGDNEWNNKKWRQLFVINEHVITAVKPYPYKDDELTKTCLTWLNELSGNQYSENDYLFGDGDNRYLNYYRLVAEHKKMYSDFSSCTHLTKIKLPVPEKREGVVIRWRFNYSGPTECMCCGRTDDDTYFSEADTLVCDDCRDTTDWVYCEHCGCRIDPDNDDYYCDDNGYYYCIDCRDEFFTYDEINGEYIDNCDAIKVYILKDRNATTANEDCDRYIWTHESILDETNRDGKDFIHQDENGEYYSYIDEAPRRFLMGFFGSSTWSINDIRNYVDKDSYKGLTMENVVYRYWYDSVANNNEFIPIVASF